MRALQALLHGSFEDAERLANEALSLGPGRPNVMFTHIDQLALLRWEQGRLGELRGEWQAVVDQFPLAAFARAWLSLADAELQCRRSTPTTRCCGHTQAGYSQSVSLCRQ
jgi:hypothetical protein